MDCLFCKIAKKEIPAKIVREESNIIAFRDINPQAPTHIIIIPKAHIEGLQELTEFNHPITGRLIYAAINIAKTEGLKQGYRVVFNCGPDGGQTVYHLHLHLLGGRRMLWPPG